ncbi:tetratricopeptide repeat protein [Candidatus Fermentibacteria bacterium]|nr:tetratricopeptide repeat protein [Candidatus Fermentibacteria bacterium]
MAHKTRKRLTKSELKHDPIADALLKGWEFTQRYLKEIIGAFVLIILVIVVVQTLSGRSGQQDARALARYLTADRLYEQAVQLSVSGMHEQSIQALTNTYRLAARVYSENPGRIWGRRAAILQAKCGVMLGRTEEAIDVLNQLMASNPSEFVRKSAQLHLAIALENRGDSEDLLNAMELCRNLLSTTNDTSGVAHEAMMAMARIWYQKDQPDSSLKWLQRSLVLQEDTTGFERYMLAELRWQREENVR